jgi:hypothetical protein
MLQQAIVEEPNPYNEVIIETFLKRAVHSALLIDDSFPMFESFGDRDLDLEKYSETERAIRLYKMFKEKNVLCDIESREAELNSLESLERIKKSDLIVLDYHLNRADGTDPSLSIQLLSRLSQTSHFNIVTLYTSEPDLEQVWLNIAANLIKPSIESLADEYNDSWDDLDDEFKRAEKKLLIDCLSKGMKIAVKSEAAIRLQSDIIAEGVDMKVAAAFIRQIIAKSLDEIQGYRKDTAAGSDKLKGVCREGMYWVQSGNLFVAILNKNEAEPEQLYTLLSNALCDWHPNLLQLMASEMQNIFELGGLAIDDAFLGSDERQVGLLYYLFSMLPAENSAITLEALKPAVEAFTSKLLESIRQSIRTDKNLHSVAHKIVSHELAKPEWINLEKINRKHRVKPLSNFVRSQVANIEKLQDESIFFELNAFMSSDKFKGSHLTTGTIFKLDHDRHWWMCCSAACDMEARQPKSGTWQDEIYPFKSIIALRLKPIAKPLSNLKDAENARRIYLRCAEGNQRQFEVLSDNSDPLWEILFLDNAGHVDKTNTEKKDGVFSGRFVKPLVNCAGTGEGPQTCQLQKVEFSVMGQLRPEYANRILQITGNYLSRIGVNFFSLH